MDLPAHQLTMTVLMTPDTANFAGNVHGGNILKLLYQVAYACRSPGGGGRGPRWAWLGRRQGARRRRARARNDEQRGMRPSQAQPEGQGRVAGPCGVAGSLRVPTHASPAPCLTPQLAPARAAPAATRAPRRYAGRYVVTLSVDRVIFRQPVHVGELVTFLASVNHTGSSSMEVGIKVVAENIRTQETRHVNSCYFTMVAVGDDSKPVPVAPLRPFTPDERRRHAAALARKQARASLEHADGL